ncbi:MAG: cobalamin B12-binding domain-containing protein [Candidatus Stahlbacteria bacterium]|nr:cobalamin B12-binding domain-containing protein [Candidatus Stahlbacteria bacterium]
MNIILLNPPFLGKFSREQRSPAITKSGTFYYPMWLAYATGVLEQSGFNVKLVDAPATGMGLEDILKIVAEFNPELVVIDTSTPSIYNDIKIGELIKCKMQNAKSQIVLVGPHVSATAEETLRMSDKIDIVCRGEYEYTLLEIIRFAQNDKLIAHNDRLKDGLKGIRGISYRRDGEIFHNSDRPFIQDLDSLPFVSKVYKNHLDYTHYFYAHSQYPVVVIIGGRGCAYQCNYCVYPQTFSGRKVRYRSIKNIVDELEYIVHTFKPLREIMFEDDTLTLNRPRCKELCEEIISRGLKIRWSANSRADVDIDTLKLMHKAGCRLLCVGFESGDQGILDNMHKGIKLDMAHQFMRNAKKARILIHGCFMVGNPGETQETMLKTLAFAKLLNPDTAQFFPIMVYPGTEAYEWAKASGYLTTNHYRDWLTEEGLHNCVVSRPGLSKEDLVRFCDYARSKFYIRPRYLVRKVIQIVLNPMEGKRILKSAHSFTKYLMKNNI